MQKIISLFQRNYDTDRLVRDEVTPGAEWAHKDGGGIATQKHDGTCCMIEHGRLWRRYEVKKGKKPPEGFRPATDVDPQTGKQQGWITVGDGSQDAYHREAFESLADKADGTYELCGPKIQGNPEHCESHVLIPHGSVVLDAPRTFAGLKSWLADQDIEGIVWHHPDGRMVKIKAKDFGIKRRTTANVG